MNLVEEHSKGTEYENSPNKPAENRLGFCKPSYSMGGSIVAEFPY